jgi:hypothetical protein
MPGIQQKTVSLPQDPPVFLEIVQIPQTRLTQHDIQKFPSLCRTGCNDTSMVGRKKDRRKFANDR